MSLTLLLLVPVSASAFDGSVSLELSAGNRTLSASLIGDWGVVPQKLYLVGTYGVVRQAPDPTVSSGATHLVGLGVDWAPSVHWMASANASFSPKATDTLTLSEQVFGTSTRRSAQGLLAAAWQSAGFGAVEWSVDASALAAWHELQTAAQVGDQRFDKTTTLFVGRPSAGLTFTFFTDTELSVRGSSSIYSQDPTVAGGFQRQFEICEIAQAVRDFNSIATLSSAPPWFDAKASVLRRFGTRVTGRLGYAFTRYVHGIGNAHAVSTRWSWKPAGWVRLWAGVTVQYDWLSPQQRPDPSHDCASTQTSFLSGYGTLGAELATE